MELSAGRLQSSGTPYLVEYTAIIRRDVMSVEEKTFLHCLSKSQHCPQDPRLSTLHLLKLVTGVEISTRPVRRSGNEGNAVNKSNRRAAAAPKTKAFFCKVSRGIVASSVEETDSTLIAELARGRR